MKKLWKALGIAALAAVVPVRFKKDDETGRKTFQSLLWKLDVGPAGDGDTTEIGLDLMEGVITAPLINAIAAKKEAELFTDDPEEAVLFADDGPDAAVVSSDVVEAAADAVQAITDEAQAIADEAQAAADEAAEAGLDPES